ncbi:MAG: hypothetical protein AAFO03_27370 [Bacteroidota bacterium]
MKTNTTPFLLSLLMCLLLAVVGRAQIFYCAEYTSDLPSDHVNGSEEHNILYKHLHLQNPQLGQGSSLLFKISDKIIQDRLLLLPEGYILCMYTSENEQKWIMVKIASERWWESIFSKLQNVKLPCINCPDFTLEEYRQLDLLLELINSIYCELDDNIIDSLSSQPPRGISQDDIYRKFNEARIEAMEEARQKRYDKGEFPRPGRLIIYNGIIYVADPVDGFVYKYIEFYSDAIEQSYTRKIAEKRGVEVTIVNPEAYFLIAPDFVNGGQIKYGRSLIPNTNVDLPDNIRTYYGLGADRLEDDEIDSSIKAGLGLDRLQEAAFFACPPEILSNVDFRLQLDKANIDAFVIDLPNAKGINNWALVTDNDCAKCGGLSRITQTEIYTPTTKLRLRVSETIDFRILTGEEASEEKDRVLASIERTLLAAQRGEIRNNEVEFLYEGSVYKNPENQWVLLLDNIQFTYQGAEINLREFNEWEQTFAKYPLNIDTSSGLVEYIFKLAARNKDEWQNSYYHNPLSFLEKYCKTTSY